MAYKSNLMELSDLFAQEAHAVRLWQDINVIARPHTPPDNSILARIADPAGPNGQWLNGTTSFFRNGRDYEPLLALGRFAARKNGAGVAEILHVGGSVGADPYSFAFRASQEPDKGAGVRIMTVDLSAAFTAIASAAVYPAWMGEVERQHKIGLLETYGETHMRVAGTFRRAVQVLPPTSIFDLPDTGMRADVVVLSNMLGYLGEEGQARALMAAAACARVGVTFKGGHMATLPYALKEAGLRPAEGGRYFDVEGLIETHLSGSSSIAYTSGF